MVVDLAIRVAAQAGQAVESPQDNAPDVVAHGTILTIGVVFLNVPPTSTRSVCPMAELKARLRSDLTAAMKAQDRFRTATLRMLLSAVRNEEVSGKQSRELTDDEVLKVLARESRKRGESAEIYTQNGRGELAADEHAEARVIDEYLPTPLTDAEVADVADTAIAQVAEETRRAADGEEHGLGDEGGDRDRRGQS